MAPSSTTAFSDRVTVDSFDGEANVYAAQIAGLITVPMAMQTAVELDLFEIIAKAQEPGGRMSAAEIADQLPAADKEEAAGMLDRLLRLLAAYSVLSSSVDGSGRRVYGLTPAGRCFVRDEDGVSLVPLMSLSLHPVTLASWGRLKDAVLEGGNPFIKAHGLHAFEYLNKDPDYNQAFKHAMLSQTLMTKKVLQSYKGFETINQVLDVGGGLGDTLTILVSKYPSLKGVNFDLPEVVKHAIACPGIRHVGGDMFESIPITTEAILLKWVLMCWGDDQCVKLLKNCHQALTSNGKVIIMEEIFRDEGDDEAKAKTENVFPLQLDTLTMTQTSPLGRVRTKEEFLALANEAGFTAVKFEHSACTLSIIELYK